MFRIVPALRGRIAAFLVAGSTLAACSGGAAATSSSDATQATGQPASGKPTAATPAPVVLEKGPRVLGERLTTRVIKDAQQNGLAVGVVAVPETWHYESRVVWNYANVSNPVVTSGAAENPANAEAVYAFPAMQFFMLRPDYGMYRQGQLIGGQVYAAPQPPINALAGFIQRTRANVTNLKFVGSRNLPELPAALKLPPSPNQRAVGVKVTYELQGTPIEEEFYGIADLVDIPYDGPQGRTWQTNWSLAVHSFRAPAGTLETRRPVFAAVAKSFRPNPAWQQRVAAINRYLAEQFTRQQQAGYDAIAAAGRLSRQISANNDAMIASIEQQRQAAQAPRSAGGNARSANDNFDDYVRGVVTVDDPYYGTSQHSANEQYHWTDGYGNYRNSNNASYDPNHSEVGSWQAMPAAR